MELTIGAFIVAKNEEENISNCLRSLSWCDELVVVDMNSNDSTKEIATSLGARVYDFMDCGYVEPALQYATDLMISNYILRLDADEIVNYELIKFLKQSISADCFDVYFLRRKNYIFGDYSPNNRYNKDLQLRFWKKGMITHTDKIHTHPIINSERVFISSTKAQYYIIHFNQRTYYEYIEKLNRYTEKEPYSELRFKGFFYEFFVRYLFKLFLLIVINRSFLKKNDLAIEYLTSTYHFIKYLKYTELKNRKSIGYKTINEFYSEIAISEIHRIDEFKNI